MRLSYATLLSPASIPIKLSIGGIHQPTLLEIADVSFEKYDLYKFLTKMTYEQYYTLFLGEDGKALWAKLSDDEKKGSVFEAVSENEILRESYLEMLNFFFVEKVIFIEGMFILLKDDVDTLENIEPSMVRGIINETVFEQVLEIIQQVCCVAEKEEDKADKQKFKNKLAKKMFEKIQKAKREEAKKSDKDLALPNIISAVSCMHPSLNLNNIWNLTVFQLFECFNRLRQNAMYEIDSRRVSTWGDEKNTFNASLWYKNNYD